MIVRIRNLKNSDEKFFIFEFSSQDDIDKVFNSYNLGLQSIKVSPNAKDSFSRIIEIMKTRLSDRFAYDGVFKSTHLYSSEMALFAACVPAVLISMATETKEESLKFAKRLYQANEELIQAQQELKEIYKINEDM